MADAVDNPAASAFKRVCAQIEARLQERQIDVGVGRVELSRAARARRVVFIMTGGRLRPARLQEYKLPERTPAVWVKPLYQADLTVAAIISAGSPAELDSVWVDVLSATRDVLGNSARADSFRMDSEAEGVGVSGRSDHEQLTQSFEWSLQLSRVRPQKLDSVSSGAPTATVQSFGIEFGLAP